MLSAFYIAIVEASFSLSHPSATSCYPIKLVQAIITKFLLRAVTKTLVLQLGKGVPFERRRQRGYWVLLKNVILRYRYWLSSSMKTAADKHMLAAYNKHCWQPFRLVFGTQHHKEVDVNDCGFAYLTSLSLLHYLVKCKSRSLAVACQKLL